MTYEDLCAALVAVECVPQGHVQLKNINNTVTPFVESSLINDVVLDECSFNINGSGVRGRGCGDAFENI